MPPTTITGKQIRGGTLTDEHISDDAQISEGKVALAFPTANISQTLWTAKVGKDEPLEQGLDFNQQQAMGLVIESGTDFPSTPIEAQVFYKSDVPETYVYTGTTWTALGSSVAIEKNEVSVGAREKINFNEGSGIIIDAVDDSDGNEVDVTITKDPAADLRVRDENNQPTDVGYYPGNKAVPVYDDTVLTDIPKKVTLVSFADAVTVYKGWAEIGSLSITAVWAIRKRVLDEDGGYVETWADGNNNEDNVWADREEDLNYG